jgi:hypothetical protein
VEIPILIDGQMITPFGFALNARYSAPTDCDASFAKSFTDRFVGHFLSDFFGLTPQISIVTEPETASFTRASACLQRRFSSDLLYIIQSETQLIIIKFMFFN